MSVVVATALACFTLPLNAGQTSAVLARSGKTVEAQGRAVISDAVSYAQAKAYAINQARALAVDSAAGISVSGFTILQNDLVVADFVKSFSRGFIIAEKIVDWQETWLPSSNAVDPDYPVFTVNIEATVLVPDDSFYRSGLLQVSLNNERYKNGEKAVITVKSKMDMFLLLANYSSAGAIIPLLPNEFSDTNVIKAGETLTFPGSRSKGMDIVLIAPRGYEKSTEAFVVIGIPKTEVTANIPWSTLFAYNREIAYAEYMKNIVNLPIPWLTEEIKLYLIEQ